MTLFLTIHHLPTKQTMKNTIIIKAKDVALELLAITCRHGTTMSALKQLTTESFAIFVLGVMLPR